MANEAYIRALWPQPTLNPANATPALPPQSRWTFRLATSTGWWRALLAPQQCSAWTPLSWTPGAAPSSYCWTPAWPPASHVRFPCVLSPCCRAWSARRTFAGVGTLVCLLIARFMSCRPVLSSVFPNGPAAHSVFELHPAALGPPLQPTTSATCLGCSRPFQRWMVPAWPTGCCASQVGRGGRAWQLPLLACERPLPHGLLSKISGAAIAHTTTPHACCWLLCRRGAELP